MRKLLSTLIFTAVTVAYPVLVYSLSGQLTNTFFAIVILCVAGLRVTLTGGGRDPYQWLIFLALLIYCMLLFVQENPYLPLLYPTLLSFLLAGLFTASLFAHEPLILRMARLAGQKITAQAHQYTWWLTLLWAVLLISNGVVAAALAFYASLDLWALYTGVLSYGIFALVFALEWVYRQHYKKQHSSSEPT